MFNRLKIETMKYQVEIFSSVSALNQAIDSRERIDGMENSSETGRAGWTGTDSIEQAKYLSKRGDFASAARVKNSAIKLGCSVDSHREASRARITRNVVGSRPCVPAAIQGLPCSMFRRHVTRHSRPVVTVVYNPDACGSVGADALANISARVVEAIKIAEASGVRVTLYAGVVAESGKQAVGFMAKIKDSDKDLDLLRMAYPLVNPSYLRRHYFAWLERCPYSIKAADWCYSYGKPLTHDSEQGLSEYLKKTAAACHCFLSYENCKNDSAEQIARRILGQGK